MGLCEDDHMLGKALEQRGCVVGVVEWEAAWESGQYDVAVVRSCWNYIHDHAAFLAWARTVEASGTRLMNGAALMQWNSCKLYLRELEQCGIPIIPTLWYAPCAQPDPSQNIEVEG